MLLPETKEREAQFKLALRMGFPIFLLTSVLLFSLLSQYLDTIPPAFTIIGIGTFAVAVYFSFYLIYKGRDEQITDPTTHMFSREYTIGLFKKELQKGDYTVVLISINNLQDINEKYGLKNGDIVLYETAYWIGTFFEEKGVKNFPIGVLKGGDFLIGLEGDENQYKTMMDILCLKVENYIVKDIEVHISGAIIDNSFSDDIDRIIDKLIEIKNSKICSTNIVEIEKKLDPDLLEKRVLQAVRESRYSIMFQKMECNNKVMYDSSIKLVDDLEKIIHHKSYMPVINRLRLNREFDVLQLEAVSEYIELYKNVSFTLNISPSSLRQNQFFQRVQTLLSNVELNGRLAFVISEKEYYGNVKRYNETLQSYRRMGIKIAIDNLGFNQTSLLYMKDLHVDMVLFDNSFSKRLCEKGYKEIIEGLTLSAKALGVKTWIKMIEDKSMYEVAKEIGIDCIQGYFIGKFDQLENILEERED
ncbi:MAG: GGDEF domain-containing protein [Campylobacterota bacterium]|nr:GGDEF domain-containing protein [Campylobacterota bacterium]